MTYNNKNYFQKPGNKFAKENKLTKNLGGKVGATAFAMIDAYSKEIGVPIDTLIGNIIYNEIEAGRNFQYRKPEQLPQYNEDDARARLNESCVKLCDFLKTNDYFTLDQIYQMHEDIGVPDKITMMETCRHLFTLGIIEEFKPTRTHFVHHAGYRRVRMSSLHERKAVSKPVAKYKPIKGPLNDID